MANQQNQQPPNSDQQKRDAQQKPGGQAPQHKPDNQPAKEAPPAGKKS